MMSISPQRQRHCRCKISQPCCCNHSATKFSPNVPRSREFGDWGELEWGVAILFEGFPSDRHKEILVGADFTGQVLTGDSFNKANLRNSNFTNADLRGVSFFAANMEE